MVANKQHLEDLAEQRRLADIAAAQAAATSTSEFDNNIDLVHSQQARIASQDLSEPLLMASNYPNAGKVPAPTKPMEYELTQGYSSKFDDMAGVFDSMTDLEGMPLEGNTYKSIQAATNKAATDWNARPKDEPAIYPAEAPRTSSVAYNRNPELYKRTYGEDAANEQLRLQNLTARDTSVFDDMVVQGQEIKAKEAAGQAKKAEQFKDDPGFSLYLRNRDAYIKQYGQDKADFYDIALGKNKTVMAELNAAAEEQGFFDGSDIENNALNFKAAATKELDTASTVLMNTDIPAAQANAESAATSTATSGGMDVSLLDRETETISGDLNAEITAVATQISADAPADAVEVTTELAKVPELKTEEDKKNWVDNIRKFYVDQPEIATALIRAASNYLQTGKWYTAAAAGLEGALQGAGVKYAKDRNDQGDAERVAALAVAEQNKEINLRSKYTADSVVKYMKSGNIKDLIEQNPDAADLDLRTRYTPESIVAYRAGGSKDITLLKHDFAKVDKNNEIYQARVKAAGDVKRATEIREYYEKLTPNNTVALHKEAKIMTDGMLALFDNRAGSDEFKNSNFGIAQPQIEAMILDHAKKFSVVDNAGNYDIEQIPQSALIAMASLVNEYGEQQYQHYTRTGKVNRSTFDSWREEQVVRQNLSKSGISSVMLEHYTNDPDGEYAGESTMMVKSIINDQIQTNPSFDSSAETVGTFNEVTRPSNEQTWSQLQKHWTGMTDKDKGFWDIMAKKQKKIPTSGFLQFSRLWVEKGDGYEFFKKRSMELFQEPK